jgi:tetratricopeptide (TPR) repeat protein
VAAQPERIYGNPDTGRAVLPADIAFAGIVRIASRFGGIVIGMPPQKASQPGRLTGPGVFLLLAALTLAALGPVVFCGFVNYDDPVYVTANPVVAKGLTGEGIWWALTATYDGNWFPLTWISHMLDVSLYGLNPAGHHLTSLLIHLANTLLLLSLLRTATGRLWPSAVAAALFAVHPLHVEVVAWVAERKELLSTFFGLLATGAYIRYTKRPAAGGYLAVVVLFALSLAAKPMWMTFPLLMLGLDIWPLSRLRLPGSGTTETSGSAVAGLLAEKSPLFGISMLSGLLALFTQQSGGGIQSLQSFPLPERIANAAAAYVLYLKQAIWPSGLSVYYPHPGSQIGFWKPALSAMLLAAITFWAVRRVGTRPYLLVGWFWYLISLLPVIGLVQLGTQAMADRYTYLPLIGICIAVAWWTKDLFGGRTRNHLSEAVVSVFVVLSLAGAARAQLDHWENSIALFEHARQNTRPNTVVLINLGKAYEDKGDAEKAGAMYRQALELNPTHPVALFNSAWAAERRGDNAEAEALYRRLLSLHPANVNAANNLASLLAETGRYREALRWYRASLAADPDRPGTLANLASLLSLMDRFQEARPLFEKALTLAPDDVVARQNFAEVLARKGHIQEAITQLAQAIRAGAQPERIYCHMAHLLAAEGKTAASEKFFLLADQQSPSGCREDDPKTASNMRRQN